MFNEQAKHEARKVVFVEYCWDMRWCDPCAADPLSFEYLLQPNALVWSLFLLTPLLAG